MTKTTHLLSLLSLVLAYCKQRNAAITLAAAKTGKVYPERISFYHCVGVFK